MRCFWERTGVLGPIYRVVGQGLNDHDIAEKLNLTELNVQSCIAWISLDRSFPKLEESTRPGPVRFTCSVILLSPERYQYENERMEISVGAIGALLSLCPILLRAQSSDLTHNIGDCNNGVETCDRSKLSQSELADVALAAHRRNVSDCRNGYDPCDRSKPTPLEIRDIDIALNQGNLADCRSGWTCDHSSLTNSETTEVNMLEHQRNAENCENGWGKCDHSKLTVSEARESALAEHQRDLLVCKDGQETCDYSKLTSAESKMLSDAEHKRNYGACLTGYGYCDLSRLTAEETRSIQPKGN